MKKYLRYIKESSDYKKDELERIFIENMHFDELVINFNMIEHDYYIFYLYGDKMIYYLDKIENDIVFNRNVWEDFKKYFKIDINNGYSESNKKVYTLLDFFIKKYLSEQHQSTYYDISYSERVFEIKYSNH